MKHGTKCTVLTFVGTLVGGIALTMAGQCYMAQQIEDQTGIPVTFTWFKKKN